MHHITLFLAVDAPANDTSGEQSSFQWLSVGVDKLKKLTNIKGAVCFYSK